MELIIYDTYEELSLKSAERISDLLLRKPDALLCFPAGETSLGTFVQLIRLYEIGKISFRKCKIVGLDEWLNLGKRRDENCLSFLKTHLLDQIDFSEENLCFFDGESIHPEEECRKTDDFINQYGPIDLILLGIGMNGHIGLNEPGTPVQLNSHLVTLSKMTRTVGQKYFSTEVKLTRGITLGLKQILESRTSALQISGASKAGLCKKLIRSEISVEFPASILKMHPNGVLLVDREAAADL